MNHWIVTATTMIPKIATKTSAVRKRLADSSRSPPTPVIEAVISATIQPTHADEKPIRMPAKMNGIEAGVA